MGFNQAEFRSYFEELLDKIHDLGYKITTDKEENGNRIVIFEKYQLIITIKKLDRNIDFDIFADLNKGVYEIGDLHLLVRKMLEVKKTCLSYNAREMNTTERLYPDDRQGEKTQTSGL